ncbi:MAG: hypothetical protein HF312_17210 [Ignavibacteria bacterium]|jgi:hypothetical protein|nr:hypothetical protein [Ignavibacteria bacterium]
MSNNEELKGLKDRLRERAERTIEHVEKVSGSQLLVTIKDSEGKIVLSESVSNMILLYKVKDGTGCFRDGNSVFIFDMLESAIGDIVQSDPNIEHALSLYRSAKAVNSSLETLDTFMSKNESEHDCEHCEAYDECFLPMRKPRQEK